MGGISWGGINAHGSGIYVCFYTPRNITVSTIEDKGGQATPGGKWELFRSNDPRAHGVLRNGLCCVEDFYVLAVLFVTIILLSVVVGPDFSELWSQMMTDESSLTPLPSQPMFVDSLA